MKVTNIKKNAFTLVEMLLVVAILGIFAGITFIVFSDQAKERAYYGRALKEFESFHYALLFYKEANEDYPPDANRDIPAGLEQYLAPGEWPAGPWPGSNYDWENWDDPNTGEKIYQISIRFCPLGEPEQCHIPNQPWAEYFDIYSSVYFCVEGPCRPHINKPVDHPGHCVNCTQ